MMQQKKIIITIDGFSSCGKSTLALQIAQALDYIWIDSGAMYRAIALYFLRHQVDMENKETIEKALENIELDFTINQVTHKSTIRLNGEEVETEIRQMPISELVSPVAAIPEVREFAVVQQRKMGEKKGIVMDGRDIGTTVFPNAELKIFLTADLETRINRRFAEMKRTNPQVTREEVQTNIENRDYIDSTRAISPLKKAQDARVLDNSHLSFDQQISIVLNWVNELV